MFQFDLIASQLGLEMALITTEQWIIVGLTTSIGLMVGLVRSAKQARVRARHNAQMQRAVMVFRN